MNEKQPDSPAPITMAGIEIPVTEQSPLVLALLAVIQKQAAEIQDLRDEIQRLKKTTTRPKIKPRRMRKPPPSPENEDGSTKKRPGSQKRKKTKDLRVDRTEIIQPEDLPPDAKFEGYRDFVVQDIVMESRNTRYRRAVYPELNDALLRLYEKREEFLAVLDHPHLALHLPFRTSAIQFPRIKFD